MLHFILLNPSRGNIVFIFSIIASGCYDGHIRLWKHFPNDKSKSNKPFGKLANHGSNVNALCFGKEGQKLYSGDGAGVIKIWIAGTTPDKLLNYECIKTIDSLTVFHVFM